MAAVLVLMVPPGYPSPTRAFNSETRINPSTRSAFLPDSDHSELKASLYARLGALETILAGFVSKDAAITRSREVTPWITYFVIFKGYSSHWALKFLDSWTITKASRDSAIGRVIRLRSYQSVPG